MKKKIKKVLMILVSILKWEKKIPIVSIKEPDKLLDGKVALITGGSGGIGMAIAKKFIDSGCSVILAGTNAKKLNDCIEKIGKQAKGIVINMNDTSSFGDKIVEAASLFGKIDIFVNCHGVHTNRKGFNLLNVTEDDYDKVMNINLRGTYFICQNVAKYMIQNHVKGHILIISSQSSIEPSWSPYRLSKYGECGLISGFAQVLLPYDIIVNGLGPGPTATGMQDECFNGSIYTKDNPIERYTMPDEVAEYAKMLVSDLGNTVVGDTLYMSGGRGIIDKR